MKKEFNENLQMKLVEKLVNKKFEYWKKEFIKLLKEEFCMGECNLINYDEEGVCPNCKKIDKLSGRDLK